MTSWQRTPEEFAARIEQALPWIRAHLEARDTRAPWSSVSPGEIRSRLPDAPPSSPEPLEAVLDDLDTIIAPGLVRWDAPGWFAWFPSNAHPDTIVGDLLASTTAQQGMLWASSPAGTELEIRMLEWMRHALGLPDRFAEDGPGGGVIQDTASTAVLCCLVAARDRATNGAVTRQGPAAAAGLVAYTSEQAHSSLLKAAGICGIGRDNLRLVPTDAAHAMNASALRTMIERDVAQGLRPFFVCATVGTTASGAIDPVEDIAEVCTDHGLWLHVDAAWAGTAALSDRFRSDITAGAAHADSWCFNPHKWMGVVFDCSCLWVADSSALVAAMSIDPEYLRNDASESGAVVDYRDWHVQLGRRFRSLKLWVHLRCTGVAALAEMVEHHVDLATHLEARIAGMHHLHLATPRSLALVCLCHVDGDAATRSVLDTLNASGRFAATHCLLDGRLVVRLAVGASATDQSHIDALCELLESA